MGVLELECFRYVFHPATGFSGVVSACVPTISHGLGLQLHLCLALGLAIFSRLSMFSHCFPQTKSHRSRSMGIKTQGEGTWDTGCHICSQFLESLDLTQPVLVEHVKSLRDQMQKDHEKLKSGIKRVYAAKEADEDPAEKRCKLKKEDCDEVKEEKVEKSEDEIDDADAACMGKQDLLRTAS